MTNRTTRILPAGVLALALASACGSSPPTTYHVLSPLATDGGAVELRGAVLVVSVSGFPSHADRNELSRFSTANTLRLDGEHVWAEPIQPGFVRTLAEDLTALGHPAVPLGPLSRALPERLTIQIEVTRFGALPSGAIELAATWIVTDADDRPRGGARRTHVETPAAELSADALVDAQSQAVHALARDIVSVLQSARP